MFWKRDDYAIEELALLAARLESATDEAEQRSRGRGGRRSRRRTWLLVGAPLVLTVAACLAVVFTSGESTTTSGPLPNLSKAAAIGKIAGAAELGKIPFPTVNQYFHTVRDVRRREDSVQPASATDPNSPMVTSYKNVVERDENWTSFYRSGATLTTVTSSEWDSPEDEAIARKAGEDADASAGQTGTFYGTNDPLGTVYIGGESVSREEIENYPTSPKRILKRINNNPMVDYKASPQNVWGSLIDAMNLYALPPKLRAGMVQTAGLIPGVTSLGPQRDKLGRQGYAFSFDQKKEDRRETVLLDPSSAMILHYGAVSIKDPAKVLDDTTLVKAEVVDELPTEVVKKLGSGQMPAAPISQTRRTLEDAKRRDAAAIKERSK